MSFEKKTLNASMPPERNKQQKTRIFFSKYNTLSCTGMYFLCVLLLESARMHSGKLILV